MSPERWRKVEELYHAALEREPDQRASFLAEACDSDTELLAQVEKLLAAHDLSGSFIDSPAYELATESLAEPLTQSLEGQTISHYKIVSRIGRGGMGEVFLAEDTRLDRKVAIKFLSEDSAADEQAKKRLMREAKAAASLDHPNICTVHEVGQEEDRIFIVMQYIEGETLAERLKRKPMELRETLDLAAQIADALAQAHRRGIIHRDIKPQNIMLTGRSQVKVLDFGLAKVVRESAIAESKAETASHLTAPGAIVGTVPYMSPEQVRGEELDHRSDIFSLGVVLYQMTAGHHPFERDTASEVIAAILEREPPLIQRYSREAPRELEHIVSKAMRKDREERYQNIKDLLIDLKDLKQEIELEARLERSIPPDAVSDSQAKVSGQTAIETAQVEAAATGEAIPAPTLSSAKILFGKIKRHKLGASLALAALIITAVAAFFYFNRQPVLTDKDTILIADFDNRTGDEIFDGTLRQGLAVQLAQSPFLNLFPETRVRETLRLMNRSPDERLSVEIGREICQRQGLKCLIAGTIAPLGSHYVITLEAINGQTGDVLTSEQVEAEGKEQVLRALGKAATELREKLGESLSSIQKFDVQLIEATTSSLEALKAYSLGIEHNRKGRDQEAIKFHKRAIELDPRFASAHRDLATVYGNLGQQVLASEFSQKAFELRERATEYEKLRISVNYYNFVTGEVEKGTEVYEMLKQTYPRDFVVRNNLGVNYRITGQYEKAIEELREALRLYPTSTAIHVNLTQALLHLNRFAEARQVLEQALRQESDVTGIRIWLYAIAFVDGDTTAMQQQIDWAKGRPNEYVALDWQASAAAFVGQWRQGQDFARRAVDLATSRNNREAAARYAAEQALRAAVLGEIAQAKAMAAQSLALERVREPLARAALALALCGESARAQQLVDELVNRFPKNSFVNNIWLPAIRAAMELRRGNAARAIELLQIVLRYEAAPEVGFWPQYVRGLAFLQQQSGSLAAAEFEKILGSRGQSPLSTLYSLAHLGLARASALTGDVARSHKAYEDFFALWKDADADIPVLQQARQEYEKLK